MPIDWVPVDRYHMTLRFLGMQKIEIENDIIKTYSKLLSGFGMLTIPMIGYDVLTITDETRIVIARFQQTPELMELYNTLKQVSPDKESETQWPNFIPHISLGWLTSIPDSLKVDDIHSFVHEFELKENISLKIAHITLFHSLIGDSNDKRYIPKGIIKLDKKKTP